MSLIKDVAQGNARAIDVIAKMGYFNNRTEILKWCLRHGIVGERLVLMHDEEYDHNIIDMGLDLQKEMRDEENNTIL